LAHWAGTDDLISAGDRGPNPGDKTTIKPSAGYFDIASAP